MTSTAPTTVVVVASIQASSVMLDPAANEAKFVPLIREAAGRGAKFIVLPETAITGYLSQDLHTVWQIPGRPLEFERGVDPAPFAETNDGPLMQRMGDLSYVGELAGSIAALVVNNARINAAKKALAVHSGAAENAARRSPPAHAAQVA